MGGGGGGGGDTCFYLVFSDKATFHQCRIVNKQNKHIWWHENPHASVELVNDSPKLTVLCVLYNNNVDNSFFTEHTTTSIDIPRHGAAVAMAPAKGRLSWPFALLA